MILRSIFSMAGLNVLKGAVAIGMSVAVAATVPPEEFGLVAFATPLVALIALVTDLGLTAAIVRRDVLGPHEAGTVVLFVDLAGAALALALAALAAPIESVARLDGLAWVLVCFSAVAFTSIAATIRRGLLERRMAYGTIARVEGVSIALGLAAFGIAAFWRSGIYAIVAYQLAMNVVRLAVFNHLVRGEYRYSVRVRNSADLFATGGTLFVANAFNFAARNLDRILIGSVIGSTGLGLYAVGYQFMTMPLVLLAWPATGIVLSALSRLGPDPAGRRQLVEAVLTLVAAATFPTMTYLAAASHWPIEQVYSTRWAGLSDVVMWLAPLGALQSIAVFNGAVLVNAGKLGLNLAFGIINGAVITLGFVASVRYGLQATILTYCATGAAGSLLALYLTCREAGISAAGLGRVILPGLASSLAGLAAAAVVGLAPASWSAWGAMTAAYGLAGIVTLALFHRLVRTAITSTLQSSTAVRERMTTLQTQPGPA